jgi:hypothetical protein
MTISNTSNEPVEPRDDNTEPADLPAIDPAELDALTCGLCLGGFAPAGTHLILGLVYTACPNCQDRCQCCDGQGLFPADTTCTQCLTDAMAILGLTPVFCHTCAGVLAVYRSEVTT